MTTYSTHHRGPLGRVLSDPLLLHSIFEWITEKRNLHMAARVCKIWCEAAMSCLWKELYEVRPWLRLLGEVVESATGLALRQAPSTQQWARFDYYAKFVRLLWHDDSRRAGISPETTALLLLSRSQDQPQLFPNVKTFRLHCADSRVTATDYLAFIAKSVDTLNFWFRTPGGSITMPRVLYALASYPELKLRSIKLGQHTRYGMMTCSPEALSAFLLSQQGLQHFEHGAWREWEETSEAFLSIAPNLMTLNVTICAESMLQLKRFLNMVATHCQNISILDVSAWHSDADRQVLDKVPFDVVEPLLALSRLERLRVSSNRRDAEFGWNDSAIQSMKNAWPRLRNISLFAYIDLPRGEAYSTPPAILQSFADIWGNSLHELEVCMDCRLPISHPVEGHATFSVLRDIYFDYSGLTEDKVPDIIQLVVKLFPPSTHLRLGMKGDDILWRQIRAGIEAERQHIMDT